MKGIYYPYLHHFLESIMMIFNISCFKIYYMVMDGYIYEVLGTYYGRDLRHFGLILCYET